MNKKQEREQKFQKIYQALEPVREAKRETIRAVGGFGRKYSFLRYPLVAVMFVYLFVYNLFLYAFMHYKVQDKVARGLATVMTLVLIITSVDITVFATTGNKEGFYKASVGQMENNSMEVYLGTSENEIELPDTIEVTLDLFVPQMVEQVVEPQVEEGALIDAPVETYTEAAMEEPSVVEVDLPVVETAAEEPVIEEPTSDVTLEVETQVAPVAEVPVVETPVVEEPVVEEPVVETPVVEEPVVETPVVDESVVETPVVDEPVVDEPVVETPVVEETPVEEETTVQTESVLVDTYVETIVVNLPVKWVCDNYDKNTEGTYVFTAQLPDEYNGYEIQYNGVEFPTFMVTVVEEPGFFASQVVDGIEINMTAIPGVFPEDAVMSVTKVDDASEIEQIETAIQNALDAELEESEENAVVRSTVTFDIVVLDAQGNEIQPQIPTGMSADEAVKVTFKAVVPQLEVQYDMEYEQPTMEIFYVDDTMETVEKMETEVVGEDMAFSPEHFSRYSCSCYLSSVKYVYSWKNLYKAFYWEGSGDVIKVRLGNDIKIDDMTFYTNSDRILVKYGQKLYIDLWEYDLIGKGDGEPLIEVKSGTVEIHDTWGGGKLRADDGSSVVEVNGSNATFTLKGGEIKDTSATSRAITMKGGTVNLIGGSITGSFSDAVYMNSSYTNTVNMSGTVIDGASYGIYAPGSSTKGSITMSGGTMQNIKNYGIYNKGTTVNMTGGTISGNSSYKTYGIYNAGSGKLNLGGNVTFSNNRAADIYVGNSSTNYINLTRDLGSDTISIATQKTPTEDSPAQFTSGASYDANNVNKFYSASNSSYRVYNISPNKFLSVGPKPNCNVTVKPVVEGINKTYTTIENGVVKTQEVGKVSIETATPTYDVNGQKVVYKYDTPIVLKAVLDKSDGYVFKGWRKAGPTEILSEDLNYSIEVEGHDTYEAVFARKTYEVSIKSASEAMGTVKYTGYTVNGVSQSCPSGTTGTITSSFEQNGKITIQATPKEFTTGKNYVFAQWSDGNTDNPRTIDVTEAKTYIAQFRDPDPDPNATGTLFIGVKPLEPSKNLYAAGNVPTKVLLIGAESGEMPDTQGLLAIAGLPANSARLGIVWSERTVYRAENNGTPDEIGRAESYYDTVQTGDKVADAGTHNTTATSAMGIYKDGNTSSSYNSYTSSTPQNGFGYYVLIDLKQENNIYNADNLYKGEAFDGCPGGWIAYSSTCQKWHYWCNNGGVQGVGPYNAYAYDSSVQFKAGDGGSNISVKMNNLRLTSAGSLASADITVDIKAMDGNTYTLANVVFKGDTGSDTPSGAQIDYVNGDRVVEFNLNGVYFAHLLPEAILSRGTGEEETRTEYKTIKEALQTAQEGDTVYVYGPAVSEIIEVEKVEVPDGVKVISYDGTELDFSRGPVQITAESDGTINLLGGSFVVTPPENDSATVGVGGGSVSTNEEMIVSADNGGQVTTTTPTQEVIISPDGNPNHTVTYTGCEEGKTYGINSGQLTTEDSVNISKGTDYTLVVPETDENGNAIPGSGTTVKTDSSNKGSVVIEKDADNGDVSVTAEKANDVVELNGTNYTATEDDTKLTVTDENENPILNSGSVDLPAGGKIDLPNGNTVSNTQTNDGSSVGVNADGSVSVPNGGAATIKTPEGESFDVSVPNTTPPNSPSDVSIGEDGELEVKTPAGSSVVIGDPSDPNNTYIAGDYDTKFEIGNDGKPVVSDGEVVLQPGQSIKDSNGVTYTNNGDKPVDLNMTKGEDTEVTVPDGGKIEYKPAGSNEVKELEGIGSGDTTISVSKDGDSAISSEVSLGGGEVADVDMPNGITKVSTPSGNTGNVLVDPVGGTITVENDGDKVKLGDTEYEASAPNTIIMPNGGHNELISGGAKLDRGEDIVANGVEIGNAGNGQCDVTLDETTGNVNVTVPSGGDFTMSDLASGKEVTFHNPAGSDSTYQINPDGELIVAPNDTISFKQNGKETQIQAGTGGATILPTEDGVQITVPAGGSVFINGKEYVNTGDDELIITVDPTGTPVLTEGKTTVPAGDSIKLSDGSMIGSPDGDISIDSQGNISLPENSTLNITKDGKTNTYTSPSTDGSTGGNVNLQYDPETGSAMVTDGSVALGSGSKIDIVCGLVPEQFGGSGSEDDSEDGEEVPVKRPEDFPSDFNEDTQSLSDLKATITNNGLNTPIVNEDGTIELPKGGMVTIDGQIVQEDGTLKLSKNTVSVPGSAPNDSISMKPESDGSITVNLSNPGDKVNINGVEYEATEAGTKINTGEYGAELEDGSVKLDGGKTPKESIIVNGSVLSNTGNSSSNIQVSKGQNGEINMSVSGGATFDMAVPGVPSSNVSFKNPGNEEADYTIDAAGNIKLGSNSAIQFNTATGDVVVEAPNGGVTVGITVGVTEDGVEVTVEPEKTVVIGGVEYKSTGDTPLKIAIDPTGKHIIAAGEAEVPANQKVYVENESGAITEIVKTANSNNPENPGKMTVSANGNIDAEVGDTIKIGNGIYTNNDETGDFKLSYNPESGEVTVNEGESSTIQNGNVTLKDTNGNKLSVSTTGNKPIDIENTPSTGDKANITIQPGGNATIDNGADGSSVEIKVPAATSEKKVVVNSTGDLVVDLEAGESITIGGIVYTAEKPGSLTVDPQTGELKDESIYEEGSEIVPTIDPGSFNKENYEYDVPAGESIKVGDVVYTAPEGGMTLKGNPNGNPIIEVNNAGSSVVVGGKTYVTGSDNTQFVVNGPNNVTLVDNGIGSENSSLVVNGSSSMVIDGNTIANTGNADTGYTITKTPEGNVIDIEDGSKLTINMGASGSNIIINEPVKYNGAMTSGNTTVLKANGSGTQLVIDKTSKDANNNYVSSMTTGGYTVLTPIKDGNGNTIGFTAKVVEPAPAPAPKPEPPVYIPIIPSTEESSEEKETTEKVEDEDNKKEDTETEEIKEVVIDTVKEAEEEVITGNTDVVLGEGKIEIRSEGEGKIVDELDEVLNACLSEEELKDVEKGLKVEIRLSVVDIYHEDVDNDKEIMQKAYEQFATKVPGLEINTTYDIYVERRIEQGAWERIGNLNQPMKVQITIPEELRKEDRTFYMLHNHNGICTMLEDVDDIPETITVVTDKFSSYAIMYTDKDVAEIEIEKVNAEVQEELGVIEDVDDNNQADEDDENAGTVGTGGFIIPLLILLALIICLIIKMKQKKENNQL